MSLYAQAAASSMTAIHLAAGGESAVTLAAYNEAYGEVIARNNANNRRFTAEANIARLKTDTILSNVKVQRNAQQARAAATLAAAVSGAEGGSVDAVMQQIDSNEQFASYAAEKAAKAQKEKLLAEVYAGKSSQLAVQTGKNSIGAGLLNAFSSIDRKDLDTAGKLFESEVTADDYYQAPLGSGEGRTDAFTGQGVPLGDWNGDIGATTA